MATETLPLPHFRRAIAQFAVTNEAFETLFGNTNVTRATFDSPDFDLTPAILWQVCDNIEAKAGPGWYLDLPAVWKSDLHGALEAAMRFAPNVLAALTTLERYGASRWTVAIWKLTLETRHVRISAHRGVPVSLVHWQMLSAIFTLNLETIFEAAFPSVLPHLAHFMIGPPPRPAEQLASIFSRPVTWNCPANASTIPRDLLETPSSMADARQFASMIAVLESQFNPVLAPWTSRVVNSLGDNPARQSAPNIAAALGLSVRTLERRLHDEGTSFRALHESRNKETFQSLSKIPDLMIGDIVARMGYSDESALSRATRRWYGATATEARRRLRGA